VLPLLRAETVECGIFDCDATCGMMDQRKGAGR
jgi:hypothetical protein